MKNEFLWARRGFGLLLVLLGCSAWAGGQQQGSGTSTELEVVDPTLAGVDPSGAKVVYWYQHTLDRAKGLEGMIADFNRSNQYHITVEGEYAGNYDEIYRKMLTAIAAGNPPNLTVAYQNQAAAYQVSGALVDLNPYVNDPRWGLGASRSDYFQGFLEQGVNAEFGDKRLSFPVNKSIAVLYYNASWLARLGYAGPPQDWAQFRAMCIKATDKVKALSGYDVSTDASNIFGQVIARGGDIVQAGTAGYAFDTPAMIDTLTYLQKLYQEGYAQKIAETYGEQTDFGNQAVLFTMDSTAGITYYRQAVEGGAQGVFDWNVAAFPHSTAQPALDIYGADVSIPKTNPKAELAAWIFVKWFTEPAQQAQWVRISDYFPVRKSAAQQLQDYLRGHPVYATAFDLLGSSVLKSEPPYVGYDQVRGLMSEALNNVLNGANVQQQVRQLQAKANQIYKQSAPQ
jgi:multiple sugar transport system substrate-binding protein